jgi:hypothetical protein
VQFVKERLELQVEIDNVKELDVCMKVKQLGMNMQKQVNVVLQPFLNFMDFFQPTKSPQHGCFDVRSKVQGLEPSWGLCWTCFCN